MTVTATTSPYLDQFRQLAPTLPGGRLPWLGALRCAGAERFAALGFPGTRQEAWKYTNLRALEKVVFAPPPAAAVSIDRVSSVLPEDLVRHRLVFVDGRFRAALSAVGDLPAGVAITSLAAALEATPDLLEGHLGRLGAVDGHALLALNTAFAEDGAVLLLSRGVDLEAPVELVFVTTGVTTAMTSPRLLVVAEPDSRATVIEHHVGLGETASFSNVVAEIEVGAGARLEHYKVQRESPAAFHIAVATARIGRDACYDNFVLTQGAQLSRSEIRAVFAGTGGDCRLSGAYMVRGHQHCDTTTLIDHAEPQCSSREVYKGALDDHSRAVFQGKIVVRPGAQRTDGHQLNRALLLSEHAEIDSKPELEIYADDVKCSHGCTVGELEDTALFYLRSRGIDRVGARALLTAAFLNEAIDEIPVEAVRTAFQDLTADWLQGS
ncbi:MAG: Fe-S cluster assembly protein SufD [Azospirillum sp.]|nr:Fe-S cluster assembly protein SufD [Azospirillum sp.]